MENDPINLEARLSYTKVVSTIRSGGRNPTARSWKPGYVRWTPATSPHYEIRAKRGGVADVLLRALYPVARDYQAEPDAFP